MAKNILVINVDIRETRVALIEGGIIAELHIERHNAKGTLGNIYLGKVSRVLPGMQAAFIDIGQERAAFLHVEDLIRPDDFEAYLAGRKTGQATSSDEHTHGREPDDAEPQLVHAEASPSGTGLEHAEEIPESDEEAAEGDSDVDLSLDGGDKFDNGEDADGNEGSDDESSDDEASDEVDVDVEASAGDTDDEGEGDADTEEAGAQDSDAEVAEIQFDAESDGENDSENDSDSGDEVAATPGGEVEAARADGDPSAAQPAVEGASEDEAGKTAPRARSRRGSRGRRKSGRTADRIKPEVAAAALANENRPAPEAQTDDPRRGRGRGREQGRGPANAPGQARGKGRGPAPQQRDGRGQSRQAQRGDRRSKADPLRVSKTTPIRDVVREGQEVIVQVSKEPIGTKGARVSSHISLPGRYVVYLPTVEHVGISKRIGSEKERGRLREAIDAMKPPTGGLIVRTLAEGLTKKSLKSDVGYLVRLWGEIAKKRETAARAPEVLYTELDLVLKTARDLFTDDIEEIVIDDREEYVHLKRFVEMFMPERADAIQLYEGDEPIFDAYGIEEEIGRALSRKVPLNSGGHLIIDQAEALTAIDVNTGRFVGKGSKDLEDTILKTNLEAVEEIAYQLRFRNIGGLIILDLIDMERATNREKVRRRLETLLANDKAKTTLNRISDLGLIEMTRKRTRESLGRLMNEPCFYCDGTGNLQSKQTVAYEILRQIKRDRLNLRGYSVVVNAHPAVVDLMKNEERQAVIEAERRYTRRIELVPRKEYHLEQFDLIGK